MSGKPLLRRYGLVLLSMVLGAAGERPASGQTVFYARDFFFTLQFKPGRDIVPDPSGTPMALHARGIYVAGAFQIAGLDFQGFLRRYDLSGNEMWTRQITAAGGAFPSAMAVDTTAVYVAGAAGFGRTELFLQKYGEGGNLLWSRQIRISEGGYHLTAGMAADASGIYFAAWDGRTEGFVRKYSPDGDIIWTNPLSVRSLRGLAVDGGVYVAGTNDGGGFVNKYTAGGDALWTRQLASVETETVLPGAVAADPTGVYVGGSVFRRAGAGDITFLPESGEAFLRKLDGSGDEVWARRFGTSSTGGIVNLALDAAGVYVAGWTERALPGQCKAGNNDIFVRKYDAAGGEQWTRQFGTSGFDFAGSVAVDSTGVYVSGGIRGGAAHGSLFVAKLGKDQVAANGQGPQISWECVVNVASYAGGGVAPGEIVTIFGRGMGPPELTPLRLAEDGRLATALADTSVLFNGIAAPLLYVSATQSSAVVPYSVAGKPTVAVNVEYRGVRSETLTLPVLPVRPGIFTASGSGAGQGAVLNEDGSFNSPENPAAKGSVIVIYATGEGLTDPAVAEGTIVSGAAPQPRQPVSVFFDDPAEPGTISPAEVLFAGGVSGSVAGLLQVNVRVPPWAPAGNAAPIYLQIGSEAAEAGVTVALRESPPADAHSTKPNPTTATPRTRGSLFEGR